MKIILNGAGGRMGKVLRDMAPKKGAEVVAPVDPFVQEEGMFQTLDAFTGTADCRSGFCCPATIEKAK